MKLALLALLCVATVFASDYKTEEGVLVLGDKDLQQALDEFDYVLGEFYAPWCGHCKKLTPEYAQAAGQLASNPNVKLAKVDCTQEKEACGKYGVQGYPTLKFFTKGNSDPIPYEGGRTASEIVNWLKKKTGPASQEVHSVEDLEKLTSDNEVVVLFLGESDADEHKHFLQAANSFDDIAFAHSSDKAIKEKYEVEGSGVVLLKKFDEGQNVHTGKLSVSDIKDFIKDNSEPSVHSFSQKIAQKIFGEGHDSIFLITDDNEAGSEAEKTFKSLGKDLKGKLHLVTAKFHDSLGGRLSEYIGVNKDHLPAIRIVQPGKGNQKFIYDLEVTAENIKNYVTDFLGGKLKPYFKSEDIPAEPYEDHVRTIVGKNYDDTVLDANSDALVEYYAPWCGHCKTLIPIFSALGKRLKDVEGLIIGKMDATANEVEGLNVQGFPTIKFYKKGDKSNPMDFNGERTEEGFIKFLKEHSSADLSSVDKLQDVDL